MPNIHKLIDAYLSKQSPIILEQYFKVLESKERKHMKPHDLIMPELIEVFVRQDDKSKAYAGKIFELYFELTKRLYYGELYLAYHYLKTSEEMEEVNKKIGMLNEKRRLLTQYKGNPQGEVSLCELEKIHSETEALQMRLKTLEKEFMGKLNPKSKLFTMKEPKVQKKRTGCLIVGGAAVTCTLVGAVVTLPGAFLVDEAPGVFYDNHWMKAHIRNSNKKCDFAKDIFSIINDRHASLSRHELIMYKNFLNIAYALYRIKDMKYHSKTKDDGVLRAQLAYEKNEAQELKKFLNGFVIDKDQYTIPPIPTLFLQDTVLLRPFHKVFNSLAGRQPSQAQPSQAQPSQAQPSRAVNASELSITPGVQQAREPSVSHSVRSVLSLSRLKPTHSSAMSVVSCQQQALKSLPIENGSISATENKNRSSNRSISDDFLASKFRR